MDNYDENIESSYITYLDANNLYGYAMQQKLPYKDFKWIDKSSLTVEQIVNYKDEDIGYLLEVDLEYPA